MTQLVDLPASIRTCCLAMAAEGISLQRLTVKESERTARHIMDPMPTTSIQASLQEAAAMPLVEDGTVLGMVNSDLLAQRYLLRLLRSQTNR